MAHDWQGFTSAVGRELKASELQPGTIIIITKEGRPTAVTAWVKDVGDVGVVFFVGALRLYTIFSRQGEEIWDQEARLHIYEYLGEVEPSVARFVGGDGN